MTIRNLKVLGLALVAVLAMSAVAASAASAVSQLTGSATKVHATDPSARFTLASENYVTCHATYTVGNINSTKTAGVHNTLVLPASSLTIAPDYTKCHAKTKENNELGPATVTMNGCDRELTFGSTIGPDQFAVSVDIVCPAGKVIEIHVYSAANHATNICTTTIGPQTGLTGLTATNTTKAPNTVVLSGTITKIKYTRHNILCGGSPESEAVEAGQAEALGATGGGESTGISISE